MTKTNIAKRQDIEKRWYLIDAEDKTLGRLASKVAKILMGKNKPIWSPNVDTGDFVVVINAEKVKVTGKKLDGKMYYRHSGYLGSLKTESMRSLMNRRPEMVVNLAVRGMLPKTKLGNQMIKKLKVYRGSEHPHQAQNPQIIEV
ncbi:MAG: 50S ribosomal protein L13 [Candidatus Ratteibacteria bacterium]|nr:50S ribosomal protein L13 [Candidatus Ratteibacteria bacterium]